MPELRLELFGGPRVTGPSGPIELSPYQQHLLTLVVACGDAGLARDRAAWLLWEEDAAPAVRHRIRQLLHQIRRRLGREVFDGAGSEAVRHRPDVLATDLDAFGAHLLNGTLRRAAELLHAGFASALPAPPTREYEDWLEARRVSLRRRLRAAAAERWDAAYPAGDWPRARDAAEALHRVDPTDEMVLRRVLEARAMTGSLQAAEAGYQEFVTAAGGEMALDAETRALVERIHRLRPASPSAGSEILPLVGRGAEVRSLRAGIERLRDGSFELLVVRGDAGIGKSRLLEEARREAELLGVRCLTAQAVEPERPFPLNALIDALGQIDVVGHARGLRQPWQTLVAAFLPPDADVDRLPEIPAVQESSLSRRLLDAFAMLLGSVAREAPTLLCLDDLQWVDDTTLALLQFVKRRWSDGHLGVLATVRPTAEWMREGDARHLHELISLATGVVELGDLADAEARRLIRETAGRSLAETVAARLCALGGRNPFYLIELTRDHLAGRLTIPHVPVEAATIPVSLQDVFQRRVRDLHEVPRRVAELLTVRARPMGLPELAALSSLPLDACADGVDHLQERRLLRVEAGLVAIAHELFRSAFYRQIPPARRTVLHLRVAEHLVERSGTPPDAELAIHFAKAGEAELAVRHGRAAADEAVANGAVAAATYFLRLVMENETDETARAEATADLAQVLHANRETERAAPVLEMAATRLRKVEREGRARRMEILRVQDSQEDPEASLEDGLEWLGHIKEEAHGAGDWTAVAMALEAKMRLLHQVGLTDRIGALFPEMRRCTREGPPEAACLAHASLAMNILFGEPDEALDAARAAVWIAEAHALDQYLLLAKSRLGAVFLCLGRLTGSDPEAERLVRSVRRLAESSGDRALRYHVESNLGVAWMDAGEYDQAEGCYARAARVLEGLESDSTLIYFLFNRGELALSMGRYDLALERFRDAEARLGSRQLLDIETLLAAGIGLASLETGDLAEARRREEQLGRRPRPLCYDPTVTVTFAARMLERRQRYGEAVARIQDAARAVRDRLPVVWIRCQPPLLRVAHRAGRAHEVAGEARDAHALAVRLGMPRRAREIEEALERYAPPGAGPVGGG